LILMTLTILLTCSTGSIEKLPQALSTEGEDSLKVVQETCEEIISPAETVKKKKAKR